MDHAQSKEWETNVLFLIFWTLDLGPILTETKNLWYDFVSMIIGPMAH